MTELLHDTHFWVLLAAIIFAVFAFIKGKQPVLSMLDGRTARIHADLEEAARLRREAQELFDDAERKNQDAVVTAQKIVDNAALAAERLQKEAEAKVDASLAQREAVLLDRIARAEAAAVQELRVQAADIAARTAEKILRDAAPAQGVKLIDDAIRDITARAG